MFFVLRDSDAHPSPRSRIIWDISVELVSVEGLGFRVYALFCSVIGSSLERALYRLTVLITVPFNGID